MASLWDVAGTEQPMQPARHPFGREKKVTQRQLLTAFFNHLYLGQWELARACATTLKHFQKADEVSSEPDIDAVLKAIIRHPHDISLGFDSISSPQHLAWLTSLHLKHGTNFLQDIPPEEFDGVEFRLMLHLAGSNVQPDILKDVYRQYEAITSQQRSKPTALNKTQPPPPAVPQLSKDSLEFLASSLATDVHLGHTIIQKLLVKEQSGCNKYNTSLYHLYVSTLTDCITSLESICGTTETFSHDSELVQQKGQFIHALLNYFDPPPSLLTGLDIEELFTSLLSFVYHYPAVLCEATLSAIFVGRDSDHLLSKFLSVQAKVKWQYLESVAVTSNPQLKCMSQDLQICLAISRLDNREEAWRHLLHWALEEDQHILAKLVEFSMTLIRERMYGDVSSLLQPEEFARLKPLLLLLGWGHVDSCSAANSLLDVLWREQRNANEEDLLHQSCQRLNQDVQLIEWCLAKAKPLIAGYGGDPSFEPKIAAIFQGSDSHSVLRLLHHFTHLSEINPKDAFQILRSRPQHEPSERDERKTVRFADKKEEARLKELDLEQKRDCAIYSSFLVLQNVMLASIFSASQSQIHRTAESFTPTSASKERTLVQSESKSSKSLGSSSSDMEPIETESWEGCVSARLRNAKEQLSILHPLTYRVEVLENLFSLLFARSEDICNPDMDVPMMSDSGGEEGHVDEEWNNMSLTSLDSIESPIKESSLLTEFTFSRTMQFDVGKSLPSRRGLSSTFEDINRDRSLSTADTASTITLTDDRTELDGKRLRRNKTTSSETNSQYSFLNLIGLPADKVGFLTNRRFMEELLTMLKGCIDDVSTAQLASIGASQDSKMHSEEILDTHIVSSVRRTHLPQYIAQLTKRVNEARWRYQLVSSHQAGPAGGLDDASQVLGDEDKEEKEVIKQFFEALNEEAGGTKGRKKRKRTSSVQSSSRSRSASGWSSSEQGSGNLSAQSQSHLYSPDYAYAATSSGNERRKRKKRRSTSRRESSTPKVPHDSGIVAQMLASEDTLLRMCLRRGNYPQAQQVIKIFDMKDKPEVSEVHFASHWQQAVKRLKTVERSQQGMSSPQPRPTGGLGGIASMAAAGIASLTLTGVIDDLLTNADLPVLHAPQPIDLAGVSSSGGSSKVLWQQLKDVNVASMVIFDLACTACQSWKTSSELLDIAVSRLRVGGHSSASSAAPEFTLTSSPQMVPSPRIDQAQTLLGIPAFMHQLHSLVNPVSSSSTALIRPDVMEFFQFPASEALATACMPLDPSTLRPNVNFILEVRRGIELLTRALESYQADIDSGLSELSPPITSRQTFAQDSPKNSPKKSQQMVSQIHEATQQLLKALDKNQMPSFMMTFAKLSESEDKMSCPANYLLTVFNHLSVLASLAVDAQDWQPGSERQLKVERDQCENPFSIMGESPSLLLGRLMFADQIPPVRLEGVASELKLNLVQIIIQSCCPTIPMLPHPDTERPPRAPTPGDYVTVLNEGGVSGEWPHPVRKPAVVLEELLNKMISLMKKHVQGDAGPHTIFDLSALAAASTAPEYWDIVMSTRELMHVDLDLVQSNEDKLCFFTNLYNLMLVHAAMHHAAKQLKEKGNSFNFGHKRHFSLGRGITSPSLMMPTPPGINNGMIIDQLAYLSSMAYKIGQMGVVSAFDVQFVILRSNLPVPSVYGTVLQHRLHALGEDDPWLRYIPTPDTRITFMLCQGALSSPRLRVLTGEDLEEELNLAMQNYLEAGVRVDDQQKQIVIPQTLEWYRKDFTGSTLPSDADRSHIYVGLLQLIVPHVSPYLGDRLEDYTLRYPAGHIELECSTEETKTGAVDTDKHRSLVRSNSRRFKVIVAPYNHSFGYRFHGPADSGSSFQKRRSSVPDNFDSFQNGKDKPTHMPPFKMTESTLKYLHSKSKLVASLAGVISTGTGESTEAFALDKSFDEDTLPSSIGSPASLVFEDTFGNEREYNPRQSLLTSILQHLKGYPTLQNYVLSFFEEVISVMKGSEDGHKQLGLLEVSASLLADVRSLDVQSLIKEALELLVAACKWDAVLKLLDTMRCLSCSDDSCAALRDFAAYCAGNQVKVTQSVGFSSRSPWQCLLTIKNEMLRAHAVLASLDSLPIEDSLELLECCVANLSRDSPLQTVLETKLKQLRMYKKITMYGMHYTPPITLEVLQEGIEHSHSECMQAVRPLCTWQDVQAESKTSPDNVLKLLMTVGDFELARDWAEIHGVLEDYQQAIQTNHLEHLLSSGDNHLHVYQILEELPSDEETVAVCSQLLGSEKVALASIVFLVQYLLHNCFDQLSLERIGELHDVGIGAKVLLCLPERVRGEYSHLMSRPDLLLEQLLMNLKMNLASDVQATLQEELQASQFPSASLSEASINALISKYAREAIKIPVARLNTSMSDTDSTLNQSLSMASFASTHSLASLNPALKGRQFLASLRGLAPSPAPAPLPSTSPSSSSNSIPVPEQRRLLHRGQSPGLISPSSTLPSSRRSSKEVQRSGDQVLSPPGAGSRPSLIPEVQEKPPSSSSERQVQLPSVPPSRDQWVPDDKVSNCMVCQDRFSMFNRRHHCRRCGRVVCWKCSQLRAIVDGYGDTPVRICDECYERFITPRSNSSSQSLEQRLKEKMSGARGSVGSGRHSPLAPRSKSLTPTPHTPEQDFGGGALGEQYFELITDWHLSLDEEHCSMAREDFYYEQAPSTSLCLSILELNSDPADCGHLLLSLCQELSEYLRPVRPGETNMEVDCNLILSMMRTLLMNSKLKFVGSGDSGSLELCDTYLGYVDLLSLFISCNCADIPSIQQLTKMDTARRIRDKLVLSERLSLAMEVSTKCGLDPGAVWSAWGRSCLQAGDYEGAREKLTRMLKAPGDKNTTQAPQQLLQEIIHTLESSSHQAIKALDILTASPSSIRDFISQPYKNGTDSEKLAENPALKECLFYIKTYGSHLTTVQFFYRHGNLQSAVNFLLQQQCPSEIFLEGVLVPCIKEGQFVRLQEYMLKIDPSLVRWHPYLTASCRHANRLGWSHILYQLQLFMKDFVRAATTCIKFFQAGASSYSDLFERLHHVQRAKDHMKAVMDDRQWGSVPRPTQNSPSSRGWGAASHEPSIRLTLSPSELTKHLNTISLQIEVTTFLNRALGKHSLVPPTPPSQQTKTPPSAGNLARRTSDVGGGVPVSSLPTLFGNTMEKAEVVHKVLLAGSTVEDGFQLAFKIIQDFRLAETKIYSRAGRRLALIKKHGEIKQLLKCHKNTGLASRESCDEILDACVRALAGDKTQLKGAEELVKLMQSDTSKINAYLLIGRLRLAYLQAVKGEREEDVRRIAMAAERAEGSEVRLKDICNTWLREREAKRKSAAKTQQVLAGSKAGRT